MRKIDSEAYNTRFPNLNSEYFDNLENKGEYLDEYSMYVKLLLTYLINKTSIKRTEAEIKDCKDFKYPIQGPYEEEQDLYQYLCSDELSYFYIRNNIYIERLSKEEKEYLDSIVNAKDFVYDEKTEKFVKGTFLKLIKEDTRSDNNGSYYVNFGPSSNRDFFALNDSLVIGARMYPGMPADDMEEFQKSYYKRINYFYGKCEELEKILNDELGIEVKVIKYSDASIRKISQNNEITL